MNVAAAATAVERCASVTGVQAMMKKTNDRIIFAPFDTANPGAKVVFVGLTPGVAQLRLALNEAAIALQEGASLDTALDRAKQVGAFAGAMRTNLITMLDGDRPTLSPGPAQQPGPVRGSPRPGRQHLCDLPRGTGPWAQLLRHLSHRPTSGPHRSARQVLADSLAVAPDALIVPLG
jgi:hypothetical protein